MPNLVDPRGPTNVPIRPINKGMIRNTPSNAVPMEAMLQVQNYRVEEYGLKRRGGYSNENYNKPTLDYNQFNERHEHSIYFYRKNAEAEQVLLTNRRCYDISGPNSSTPHRLRSSINGPSNGSANAGDEITLIFTYDDYDDFTKLRQGDKVVKPDLSLAFGEVLNVTTSSDPTVTVDVLLYVDINVDDLFIPLEFDHLFYTNKRKNVSYAVLPYTEATTSPQEKMIIADQSQRGLYTLSEGTLNDDLELMTIKNTTDTGLTQNPYFVAADGVVYFADRVWAWGITDRDTYYSQRIRWSLAGNFEVWRDEDFIDLPYSSGEIINLVPMGPLLIAYFTDAIYVGRQTSIIGLPYKFEKLETGNVGLVNQKAVSAWIDGHFFVGEDNIYFISGSAALQEIGSTVLQDTLDMCRERELMHLIQLEHDPPSSSIVFYFPENGFEESVIDSNTTKIWRWHYRTKAWAFDEVPYYSNSAPVFTYTALLATRTYNRGNTWEQFGQVGTNYPDNPDLIEDGSIWLRTDDSDGPSTPIGTIPEGLAFSDYNSWDQLKGDQVFPKQLYLSVEFNAKVIILEETLTLENDVVGQLAEEFPIRSVLESPDYDLGSPDISKIFTRLSLKTYRTLQDPQEILTVPDVNGDTFPLGFDVQFSGDFGYSWKRPTSLRLRNNYNEGKVDFRSTGSTLRFRLINDQFIEPYKISEFVLRVIGQGLQIRS